MPALETRKRHACDDLELYARRFLGFSTAVRRIPSDSAGGQPLALATAGKLRNRPKLPERPTTGWAWLTKSEHTVVRLVTRRMTNREVAEHLLVSPHTVNAHVRHVFTKLGIGSRVELTRIATENAPA